ncbi:hypothetical protein [Streptomyces sp. SID5910]|nr:hypothetical protein [Streptomyces sp. SID5910]MYR41810.1 hypothetical protein [Streptomyces sp. SID5910]
MTRLWLTVVAPPWTSTSLSQAAARARAGAYAMPSVTKWYVVPPAIGCAP